MQSISHQISRKLSNSTLRSTTSCLRNFSSAATPDESVATSGRIKWVEDKGKAEEKLYFQKEDERLIQKMLEKNPELADDIDSLSENYQANSTEDKVKLVFMRNGLPPNANPQLMRDLVELIDSQK